jgi:hypothetical protein
MMEFLKRATEWILDKEEEMANNCRIDINDIQKQITMITIKRDTLEKECKENLSELDHILKKLETIKYNESACII